MGWGRILPVVVVLWGSAAAAQTPWPAQQPQQQQQAPWPGAPQQQQQKQAAWPAPQQQQPQNPAAWPSHNAAPGGAPPMMAPGMMGPGGGGRPPPCLEEFTKLRGEVEKRGAAAKVASDKHVAREEFCKAVTALWAASNKWAKFTVAKASSCGIPSEAVTQIKAQDEHLGKLKEQVCNTAAAAPGAGGPPSLSEALGTDKLPLDDSEKAAIKRGGVLDSLTGTPIR
jgi:hypothetical protein